MTCEGCAGAVKRILTHVEGVQSVSTDVASKSVVVTGTANADDMLTPLRKWADASQKEVTLIQ